MKNIKLIHKKRGLAIWSNDVFWELFIKDLEELSRNSKTDFEVEESNLNDDFTIKTFKLTTFEDIMAIIKRNSPRFYKNFYETTDRNGDIIYKLFENNEEI